MKVFHSDLPFFKGNLHMHTTVSDGALTPEEATALYRQNGYDFIALTDHRVVSAPAHFEEGMLLLPGIELDYTLSSQVVHLVGVGMTDALLASGYPATPQAAINGIRAHGGRAVLCHPAWSLNTLFVLSELKGLSGAEVYNTTSTLPHNGQRADSSNLLDIAATNGCVFPFMAADDAHYYGGVDDCQSYVMVQAPALTQEALLSAIDSGRFYATQGPRFESLSLENGRLHVSCSPCSAVVYYSNLVWANDRVDMGEGLTESEYRVKRSERFVRVQLIDAQGRSAWSSPIAPDR